MRASIEPVGCHYILIMLMLRRHFGSSGRVKFLLFALLSCAFAQIQVRAFAQITVDDFVNLLVDAYVDFRSRQSPGGLVH